MINNSIIISTSRLGLRQDGGGGEKASPLARGLDPDENINLHTIKAAAIKAIEIMQIIEKTSALRQFLQALKIISTPLVDEY